MKKAVLALVIVLLAVIPIASAQFWVQEEQLDIIEIWLFIRQWIQTYSFPTMTVHNLTVEDSLNVANVTYINVKQINTSNITAEVIYLGTEEGNSCIYFYEDGSPTGESLCWNDASDIFIFTDGIYSYNEMQALGDIFSYDNLFTADSSGDLWLGTLAMADSRWQAHPDGSLNISDGNFTVTPDGNQTAPVVNVTEILYLPSGWCYKDGGGSMLLLTSDC